MTRDEVIAAAACPSCGAPIGERCHDGGRGRRANHIRRIGAAEALSGWRSPRHGSAVVAGIKYRRRQAAAARRR